jgi:hypothetical protein
VQELDGVLDGHHMLMQCTVDVVHHGCHGRALAATAHARDENQATVGFGDDLEYVRQPERLDSGNREGYDPHHDHEGGSLAQHVHPEPAHAGHTPGTVEIAQLVNLGAVLFAADELEGDGPGLIRCQALLGQCHQLAVDPGPENVTGLDVQVGGAAFDCRLDDLLHGCPPL